MKKIICIAMSLLMLLSFAACGEKAETETTIPQETTLETTTATEGTTEPEAPKEMVTSFYMDMKNADQEITAYMMANLSEGDVAFMEYHTASGKKSSAEMDLVVLEQLAAAYRLSTLSQFNGQDVYDDGTASCCVSLVIGEETCDYTYYGEFVPEEFATIFEDMEALFVQLMADVPEYVPTMLVEEGVNEEHLTLITEIMNNSGYEALDSITVMNVPGDENFGYIAGLTSNEGITACTSVTHMMMTTPYSMVVVTLEEGADAQTVVADFKASIDWGKWVCVNPSSAIVATKDNMVLCLIGLDELYTGTASAVESTGWTITETLSNPNL